MVHCYNKDSIGKRVIIFNEYSPADPQCDPYGNVRRILTPDEIIPLHKGKLLSRFPSITDEEVVEDFIIQHWAWEEWL